MRRGRRRLDDKVTTLTNRLMSTRSLLLTFTGATLAFIAVACGGDVSGDGPGVPDGATGDGGSTGCTGATVAAMVTMPQGYSIDATEVTRCQYQAWLDTNPSVDGQDPWCSWNTDYAPTGAACGFPPVKDGDLPVGCVDWCDAYAYCRGVGKRLCGKIGGGPNAMVDYMDPAKSQWFNACSSGGKYYYTYGDAYDYGSKCNDADRAGDDYTPVASLPDCQSPDPQYAGVYDLTGNVWEFEDSCQDHVGAQDFCELRGGSFASPEVYSFCSRESSAYRGDIAVNFGFRCCSE